MPEIRALARAMRSAMDAVDAQVLQPGEWHLPFVDDPYDLANADPDEHRKLSVARAARVSYLTHDLRRLAIDADLALFDRLLVSEPLHASPAEHQATPDVIVQWVGDKPVWEAPHKHGNLVGWRQYRKMLPGEHVPAAPAGRLDRMSGFRKAGRSQQTTLLRQK